MKNEPHDVGAMVATASDCIAMEFIEHIQDMTDERLLARVGVRRGLGAFRDRTILITQNAKIGVKCTCTVSSGRQEQARLSRVGNYSKHGQW